MRSILGLNVEDILFSVSLKPIDIEFMRQLHTRVNLIPIIAKADTLTDEEIAEFKARVCLLFLSTDHEAGSCL